MTKQELFDSIRTIVQEEVRTQLPNILIEILAERIDVSKNVVTEVAAKKPAQTIRKQQPQQPKQERVFSKNPVLNQILNETQGGIPQDDDASAAVDPRFTPEVLAENRDLAAVNNALNRDYRSLLKAADAKAKSSYRP